MVHFRGNISKKKSSILVALLFSPPESNFLYCGEIKLQKKTTCRYRLTHICGFLVVVDLVDSSGQAEVGDLHHVVLGHQNVSGCQISVDALQREERELETGPKK